jgi:hypothetical protein
MVALDQVTVLMDHYSRVLVFHLEMPQHFLQSPGGGRHKIIRRPEGELVT